MPDQERTKSDRLKKRWY